MNGRGFEPGQTAGLGTRRTSAHLCGISFIIGAIILPGIIAPIANAAEDVVFFEKRIRPLLVENCYKCHSAESEKLKGGLRLDSRDGILKGGESGPAMVAGDPEKSLLIKAVRYTDKDLQMPPKNKKLSDRQIADLTDWIRMGGPWPTEEGKKIAREKPAFEITDKDRAWWAFQPIKRPAVPVVSARLRINNAIDSFIIAQLQAKGLELNPPATKRELIRRAYFDLIGLPPTPEQTAAFEKDRSPDAYLRLIDQLLSLPQYGERWGRHWLDVVRFAQSNGYERDGEKPMAWRYRDYVIKAFNEDKPYDRFIYEQLAGDELPDATMDSIVATGFQRLGVWDDEPDDKRMAEFDELDDIVSTTSGAFLGLTMGCARCHDHKFDPISQTDYYQFLSFFRNVRPYENAKFDFDSPNFVPFAPPENIKQWQQNQEAKIKVLEAETKSTNTDAERKRLQATIKKTKADPGPFEWALAVKEHGGKPAQTHVLVRGNPRAPAAEVHPAYPAIFGGQKPSLVEDGESTTSGRRLALATWIGSPHNPLTARVIANRLWQHHFGQGIVKSTTDFGRAGIPPTNPLLLDWLATALIDSGWSLKKMHRLIMLSSAYSMSSRTENAKATRIDPGNDLLWRQNLRRLEAEAIRDSILQVTGELNPAMGGRGFFPHLGGEVLAGASRPGLDWQKSPAAERSRRSIYTYIRRTMLVPAMDTFDYSNTTSPLGERPVTTVAPQALLLLNDDYMQEEAAAFARRLIAESGHDARKQVRRGYQRALGRNPNDRELQIALQFLQKETAAFQATGSRLTFRPDVPTSLSVEYINQLNSDDFLVGPRDGWTYYRGRWAAAYEGIRTVDRQRGPFALWNGEQFSNGVIQARLALDRTSEVASLLLRATATNDELRGYEVALDPRQQRLSIRRHAAELTTLAETNVAVTNLNSIPIRIELDGATVRVWLNNSEKAALKVVDPKPASGNGAIGVRTWGAALSVDDFTVASDGTGVRPEPLYPTPKRDGETERRALQLFCLMLLNLNEFVYVD